MKKELLLENLLLRKVLLLKVCELKGNTFPKVREGDTFHETTFDKKMTERRLKMTTRSLRRGGGGGGRGGPETSPRDFCIISITKSIHVTIKPINENVDPSL